MNCFNIRELQGILKRRFFTDLVNSNDHRDLLNDSMIGLRFKLNNSQSIEPDIFSFYNIGTTNTVKTKNVNLNSIYDSANASSLNTNFSSFLPSAPLSSLSQSFNINSITYTTNPDLNSVALFHN
jgi:hypothetical protein